jgi:hypothetical protein
MTRPLFTGPRARLLLLLGCVSAGLLAGLAGQHFTASNAWFLAVPACLAAGWLFVANPAECAPPEARSSAEDSRNR